VGLVPLVQEVFTFRPASYTGSETKTLFTVRDAYFRVTSADVRIETAFSGGSPTIAVGVSGGDVDNLVETGDITIGTPGVYKGTGLGLDSGGALYAPGTAIAVTYTAHASTTQGVARIAITGYRVGV
jgi:hypothetical protein